MARTALRVRQFDAWWRASVVLLIAAGLLGSVCAGLGADLPMADVTIEVVDEDGTPVADALVYVAFQQGRSDAERRGVTDAKGLWRVQERASAIESFCSVKRKGYYESIQRLDFTRNVPKGVQVTRRWPAMTCRVVLRPIGEPALGFGQGHDLDHHPLRYPAGLDGQEIGYDFLIGDWVNPHGKGVQADML